MDRAEESALKAYPVNMTQLVYQDLIDQFGGKTEIDVNTYPRCLFQEGYEQAEKDLALTPHDIELIVNIDKDLDNEEALAGEIRKNDEHFAEVLRRFNEAKI